MLMSKSGIVETKVFRSQAPVEPLAPPDSRVWEYGPQESFSFEVRSIAELRSKDRFQFDWRSCWTEEAPWNRKEADCTVFETPLALSLCYDPIDYVLSGRLLGEGINYSCIFINFLLKMDERICWRLCSAWLTWALVQDWAAASCREDFLIIGIGCWTYSSKFSSISWPP